MHGRSVGEWDHVLALDVFLCCALIGLSTLGCVTSRAAGDLAVEQDGSDNLRFSAGADGAYQFDTGVVRGEIRLGEKTLGLSSLVHKPTGARLDGRYGILSYYRIFTAGKRYGHAAWDWPCDAKILPDGSVQIFWHAQADHPFEIAATYRWLNPSTLDVVTRVKAEAGLADFEVFLASYFDKAFEVPSAYVSGDAETAGLRRFLTAKKSYGNWQMFPRDADVVSMIRDGRWTRPPNPVDWAIMPQLAGPVCMRRGSEHDLTVVLMSSPVDCFAVSMAYEGETHYSLYLSLFGRDIAAGDVHTTRCRFLVASDLSNRHIVNQYEAYLRELIAEGRSGGDR